jgi:rhodanese-related sulfurtransferase
MSSTQNASNNTAVSWKTECLRALAIVICSSVLAIGVNAFSKNPVPLLDANGPGALPERAPRIQLAQLKEAMAANKVLVLDVRHEDTFAKAHPQGSINAPAEKFIEHYGRLNLGAFISAAEIVVVVCDSELCPAGDRVAKILESMNHKNVRVLQGGWDAYEKAGLETTK